MSQGTYSGRGLQTECHVTVRSRQPARTLVDLVKWIDAEGYELVDVHLRRPTLEDVFIEMTGKKLRD